MLNPKTYLLPELARSLPDGSTERALASLALRNLWHAIFDSAPAVLRLSPPDGKMLLEAFLMWADEQNISMSWSLHVHLLDWLQQISPWHDQITPEHIKELLAAAAARWAISNMEHIEVKGILIGSIHFPGFSVGAWKSSSPRNRFRIVLLKTPDEVLPQGNGYVLSYVQNEWGALKWITVPK